MNLNEIITLIDNGNYKIADEIVEHKDLTFPDNINVSEYIKQNEIEKDPDSTFILLVHIDNMFELNLSGAIIWELLKERKKFKEILAEIECIFLAENNLINNDILLFIQELERMNFITFNN